MQEREKREHPQRGVGRRRSLGAEAVTAFRGSQESVFNCGDANAEEVIENVESSV